MKTVSDRNRHDEVKKNGNIVCNEMNLWTNKKKSKL